MIRLRCAPSLLDLLQDSRAPADDLKILSRLGDWSAIPVFSRRRPLAVCLNDRTLYPLVLPVEPRDSFLSRFRQEVWALVVRLTEDPSVIWAEAEALVDIQLEPFRREASPDPVRRAMEIMEKILLEQGEEKAGDDLAHALSGGPDAEASLRRLLQAVPVRGDWEGGIAVSPDAPGGAPAPSRPMVLVVDDLKDCADSLAMFLRAAGVEVHTAYGGEDALTLAEKYRPRVVTLDIGMPRLNGYDTCRQIRQQPWGKEMVVIALTGWGQERDRRMAEESGFDHYLVKPADPARIMELLGTVS